MALTATPDTNLFKNRTPEAAARQLAIVLAWATEKHLALMEDLKERPTYPKKAFRRQVEIGDRLVGHCFDLGIPPGASGLAGEPCPLLTSRLLNYTPSK